MDDILEFILSILFMPFESKYENLKLKIKKKPNKLLRFLLKSLLVLIIFALVFGIYCLCNYIFKGYWIYAVEILDEI